MSSPAVRAEPLPRLSPRLDHDAWVAFLADRLWPEGEWRPGEFDPERWLFSGDPDNPMTTSARCLVAACTSVVASRQICNACERAMADSGLNADDFLSSYQPPLRRRALTGEACVVIRDGVRCQRRRISNQTGMCQFHSGKWNLRDRRLGITLEEWCHTVAQPLPPRPACLVAGCRADARLDVRLCGGHFRDWRLGQASLAAGQRQGAEEWAAARLRRLRVNQFSLTALAPTVRVEVLYALQQRDRQGLRLDPQAVRTLVPSLVGLEALATTPEAERRRRVGHRGIDASYGRLTWRIVDLTFEAFRGMSHTDRDSWDALALDLETPRPGRRPNRASIDFSPISQVWLREATKHWVNTVRPGTAEVKRAIQTASFASVALAGLPGGGHEPASLGFAEVTAIYEAIKGATRPDGQPYHSHYRRGLWARWWSVIDLGRASGLLDRLPGSFVRQRSQRIVATESNEEQIGKAVPETVIAQLDAHLDLLDGGRTYGMLWSRTDTAVMFRAAYIILRDTGRRPGELVSLAAECLEVDGGEHALVYDNHKKGRLRRRLPITVDTAAAIRAWQEHRAGLLLPAAAKPWLFPAPNETSGPGHLTTIRLSQALRAWVDAIPHLHSDVPGPDGNPLPFDRKAIFAYAFRHSYAQRHADAGIGVEILQELMDHRDPKVTQGYYTVSLKRKRQAIKIMSRYVTDRTGSPRPATGSAVAYELRSVAVPFGNCIEPSNVKAGGQACPIRFQCAGCGFYRPDPSYLPAIEEHINALRADRETALAMDAEDFVVRNLTEQAAAFTGVAQAMRDRLACLPDPERAEIEAASATLRKMRAGRTLIPVRAEDIS
ncbi:MAG: site-specific integrase [Acidobacteriota bacterium]|nr:site-specific integrase [Acidobacteriota bacterium]